MSSSSSYIKSNKVRFIELLPKRLCLGVTSKVLVYLFANNIGLGQEGGGELMEGEDA